MIKPFLTILSLLFVFACAGFSYKWYGVDTHRAPTEVLKQIDLVAGRKQDTDKTMQMCITNEESDSPNCIVMTSIEFKDLMLEFQEMKTRLKNCEKP